MACWLPGAPRPEVKKDLHLGLAGEALLLPLPGSARRAPRSHEWISTMSAFVSATSQVLHMLLRPHWTYRLTKSRTPTSRRAPKSRRCVVHSGGSGRPGAAADAAHVSPVLIVLVTDATAEQEMVRGADADELIINPFGAKPIDARTHAVLPLGGDAPDNAVTATATTPTRAGPTCTRRRRRTRTAPVGFRRAALRPGATAAGRQRRGSRA